MMCEDFPCIAACQPDVLTSRVRPMMGFYTDEVTLAASTTTRLEWQR